MKLSIIVAAALAEVVSAHYFFDTSTVKGVTSKKKPVHPKVHSSDMGGGASGTTEVMTIAAGTAITFTLGVGASMAHPGTGMVYMSLAPTGSVKEYDGSGSWFKIWEEGICNKGGRLTDDAWCTWKRNNITATIPKETPNGEYLVRVEHIAVHRCHIGEPEQYVSCMQVKVIDGGTGTPGPLVKFPGAYKDTDPYAHFSVYNGMKDFPSAGPDVWNGSSSGAVAGAAVDGAVNPGPAPIQTLKTSTTKAAQATPKPQRKSGTEEKPASQEKPAHQRKPASQKQPEPQGGSPKPQAKSEPQAAPETQGIPEPDEESCDE
ncbi:related to cellulose binding protein CEL1 [Rhynchosporium agropyri]|uniref:AA9 family lytic polysaccharide monooxygenase n=1 Tax=Rhynchosporium agropyri TaxID=914238 RepID=A0A1E1KQV0_9HELO|nr:related to cellulose binding protein CEL1 [Rhynchosporium agropyri]